MDHFVKVKLGRAKNINACTSLFSGKSRTLVTAKAAYKNLVYKTCRVEDMGQNPVWDEDGSNVFHFVFKDRSGFITLELFNRNNECIGVSRLLFSDLGNLRPGTSETKTLPVMVNSHRQYGELILSAEILEQQAMGDMGLLTVVIRKGQMIQRITSVFGSRTTKISAKLIYKHTTYSSGVLENMGNRFVWHEDNVFTFIINSDFKADDVLKLEVYNLQNKVGECEMAMSLFIEQGNLQRAPSELVAHSMDLCLPNRGTVGNIEVEASFTPNPICRRNSYPQTHPYAPPQNPYSQPSQNPYSQPPQNPYSQQPRHVVGCMPHPGPHTPVFDPRSLAPSRPEFYPPPVAARPEFYPPAHVYKSGTAPHSHPSAPDQIYRPSAPVFNQEVLNYQSRGSTSNISTLPQDLQNAHGAPAGRVEEVNQYSQSEDEMFNQFLKSYH